MHKKMFDRESISVNLSSVTNPKYEIVRQKMKELFLVWLNSEINFDQLEKMLNDDQLVSEAPHPLQEEIPTAHSTLNKSFVAPPVIKKKDTNTFLSKTIVPGQQRRNHMDYSNIKPKMSLLKTTREEKSTSNSIINLNFILLTNSFGEEYNQKEERIESLFQNNLKLNTQQLKSFVAEVLELPEAYHIYLGSMSKLIREYDTP